MDKFEKSRSITDGASSEWEESKHPRDDKGKFTDGAGNADSKGFEKAKSITDAANSEAEQGELTNPPKSVKLAIDSPATRELHERLSRGELLSFEELANHPAVTAMDALAEAYREKYDYTFQINTPERETLRKNIEKQFLAAGSYTGRDANGEPVFNGPIRREFKAVIAIGLPAAGKSTNIAEPDSKTLGAFVFDNDEIKKLLPEYQETKGGAAGCVHRESQKIQEKAFEHFLTSTRQGDNLVIPVVGSDLESLQKKWIHKLENAGYDVEVKYQDADPVASANRVVKRAIESGRIIKSEVSLEYKDKPRQVWEALKGMKGKGGKPYVRTKQ